MYHRMIIAKSLLSLCSFPTAVALTAVLLAVISLSGCASNSQMTASNEPAASPGPTDPDAPTEFTRTASGLKYKILRKSDGKKPTVNNVVTVHYKGWLDNGKVFDSSYQEGEPVSFPLQQVVPGWTEGLQFVGEGGMIELEIPSDLGYGSQGSPGAIPPNATLHFIVELLQIL